MSGVRAVARKVVIEALRLRSAWVFALAFLALLAIYPFVLAGDGTLAGRLRMFLSYALGTTGLLLSVFTIVLGTATLSAEIERRELPVLATKPIPRWAVLAGKWLGLVAIDLALLACAGIAVWLGAARILGAGDPNERADARDRVLAARIALVPDPRPVDPERERALAEELLRDERLAVRRSEASIRRAVARALQLTAIRPSEAASFTVRGIRQAPGVGGDLVVRYRFEAFPLPPSETVALAWTFGADTSPDRARIETRTSAGGVHEMRIPAALVDASGALAIQVRHADPNPCLVIIEPERGIEVLARAGGFEGNLARALVLLALRLAFIAALALLAASFLSGPVALLAGLTVVFVALGSGFFLEGLHYQITFTARRATGFWRIFQIVWGYAYTAVLWILPRFDPYDPAAPLADGRAISWGLVARAIAILGIVQSGAAALLAAVLLRRRELGRSS
ncbi:MAG: ABC transporter permease subunit [Planctomycetes bacterium]|nr:ABC transporter permease subunit [Planctomycetota bacterium]